MLDKKKQFIDNLIKKVMTTHYPNTFNMNESLEGYEEVYYVIKESTDMTRWITDNILSEEKMKRRIGND